MSIDPTRYVEVSANGSPTDPQAVADLAAAAQAGAIAGDIAGRAAGAEAGAAAGTEVAESAGAAAGAIAGEIAGTAAGTASGATAGAVAGGSAGAAAGATAGAAAATAVVALKADKTTTITGGGLATGGGSLAADRVVTVTAASQAEAETGTATAVAMTPQRTTQNFNARVTTFMRTVTLAVDAAAARVLLEVVGLAALSAGSGSALVGYLAPWLGAVVRLLSARLGDVVSIKDFGAVGDGVTDDTAAFNLAIAYANAKGGVDRANIIGTNIFLPQGRYPIGQLNPVTVSGVQFSGPGPMGGTVLLHSFNGATFRWSGPVGDTIVGGGLTGVHHEYLATPPASACLVEVSRANALDFSGWHFFNVACALRLGTGADAIAAGLVANTWTGGVANMDTPLIDLRYGAGFEGVGHYVFVSGVVTPPLQNATFTNASPVATMASTAGFFAGQDIIGTARVPGGTTVVSVDSPTQITMSANATSSGTAWLSGDMTTVPGRVYIRGTVGFWDTCQISNSLIERFDQGIGLGAGSGQVYQHFCLSNVTIDYTRRHCIYGETSAGGVINSVSSDNLCWFVSWETAALQMVGTAGTMDDWNLQGKVPISGAEALSYNVSAAKRCNFSLAAGGVNRLQGAPAALYFVPGSKGFTAIGCTGNDDVTALGLPFRADWGITLGADCDEYVVTGNRMSGVGGFLNWFAGNTTGSAKRQISANGDPGYAAQQTGGIYVLPASGAAFTNTNGFAVEVIISGGTVTQIAKNGVNTGLTSGVFLIGPGETLTPTYSVAPTMLFFGVN